MSTNLMLIAMQLNSSDAQKRHAAHPKHCRDAPGLIPLCCSRRAAELSRLVVHTYVAYDDAGVAVR
jgi:hypothetical protein